MKSLTVISPVFEEAESLPHFNDRLLKVFGTLSGRYSCQVLYVCDPGRDGTEALLEKLCASSSSIKAIILSRRFGHQAALLAGIDHADTDAIIMMDCDLQHPPEVLPELLLAYESGNEVVHAIREYSPEESLLKRKLSSSYYRFLGKLSETPIKANGADFRLVSGRVARLFSSSFRERNLFLRGLFVWIGFRQADVYFEAPVRKYGSTKYNLGRMIRFATSGVVSFSKRPLRIATYIGAVSALFGLSMAIVTFIQYIVGLRFPSGWATLVIISTLLGGAQLCCIGVLGEYLGYIFDEVKARPLYLVDKQFNVSS